MIGFGSTQNQAHRLGPVDPEVKCRRRPAGASGQAETWSVRGHIGHQPSVTEGEAAARSVVPSPLFGPVRQNGRARHGVDDVVARAGIGPYGDLHGRPDVDDVIAPKGVDDDGEEIVLGREGADRKIVVNWIPLRIGGAEAEIDLGVEGEIAVVVGQAGDDVATAEQTRFGHIVDRDHVVGIGAAIIPNLVRLLGVFLPRVIRETTIGRFESGAVGAPQGVFAAVAIEEVQSGAAIELIVKIAAQDAVESGVFNFVDAPAVIVAKFARLRVHINPELGNELDGVDLRSQRQAPVRRYAETDILFESGKVIVRIAGRGQQSVELVDQIADVFVVLGLGGGEAEGISPATIETDGEVEFILTHRQGWVDGEPAVGRGCSRGNQFPASNHTRGQLELLAGGVSDPGVHLDQGALSLENDAIPLAHRLHRQTEVGESSIGEGSHRNRIIDVVNQHVDGQVGSGPGKRHQHIDRLPAGAHHQGEMGIAREIARHRSIGLAHNPQHIGTVHHLEPVDLRPQFQFPLIGDGETGERRQAHQHIIGRPS